jgi:hypothetical protein
MLGSVWDSTSRQYCRNVLDWKDADSTEFEDTPHAAVMFMPEVIKKEETMGGTMRLGSRMTRIYAQISLGSMSTTRLLYGGVETVMGPAPTPIRSESRKGGCYSCRWGVVCGTRRDGGERISTELPQWASLLRGMSVPSEFLKSSAQTNPPYPRTHHGGDRTARLYQHKLAELIVNDVVKGCCAVMHHSPSSRI